MNAKVMERLMGRDFKDDFCFFGQMEMEKNKFEEAEEEQNAKFERFLRHPQNNVLSESQDSLDDVDSYGGKMVGPTFSNSTVVVVASDGDNNKISKRFRSIFTAPSYNSKNNKATSSSKIEINNNNNNNGGINRAMEPLSFPGAASQQSTVNVQNKKTAPSRLGSMSAIRLDLTDTVFNKKFRATIEKTIKLLNDIKRILEAGIPNPDGDEDYQRRLKRSTEFSARFSRIYLYPLLRQVNDLSIIPSKPGYPGINHKILCPHQTILQALQAYLGHLPTSVGKCCSDKLKALLDQAFYLSQMYNFLKKNTTDDLNSEFTNAMQTHVELLSKTLENFNCKFDLKVCSAKEAKKAKLQEQSDTNNGKRNKKRALNKTKKKNCEKKLSMYTVTAAFRKDAAWKKAVEGLSKKKIVKSRYKTATYKHRPPVEKSSPESNCNKLTERKSSGYFKMTPINTPIKEDEIKTMMDLTMNNEFSTATSPKERASSVVVIHQREQQQQQQPHEEFATRLLQLVRDNDRLPGGAKVAGRNGVRGGGNGGGGGGGGGEDESAKKAAEKLGRWLMGNGDGGGVAVLTRLVQEMEAKNKAIAEENRLEFVVRTPAGSEGDVRKPAARKEPTVTQIIGAKNAKLICLRDDNSDQSSSAELHHGEEKSKVVQMKSSRTQTKLSNRPDERKQPSKSNIKISRLPRNTLRPLRCLPKTCVINVIQYKLEFHKHAQQDHMYRKSANIHPWYLMSRISDQILDDIVHAVSKELEVSEILENLYNAEFQY